MPQTGDPAHNTSMCPDRESNQQPFGSKASAQFTKPYQPGQNIHFLNNRLAQLVVHETITLFIFLMCFSSPYPLPILVPR